MCAAALAWNVASALGQRVGDAIGTRLIVMAQRPLVSLIPLVRIDLWSKLMKDMRLLTDYLIWPHARCNPISRSGLNWMRQPMNAKMPTAMNANLMICDVISEHIMTLGNFGSETVLRTPLDLHSGAHTDRWSDQ
jgi:hypothetical protein